MNRYLPWTICGLLLMIGVMGSLAASQWEPQDREKIAWFTPPPITEDDLIQDVAMQELCYLVLTDYHGGHTAAMYRVKEHEASGKDDGWFMPPKVPEEEKRSVWRAMQRGFNATFNQGNRFNR